MFRFSVDDKKYVVEFEHYKIPEEESYTLWSHATSAILSQDIGHDMISIATGNAYCSRKDNFSRAKGRKISFGRVLLEAFPDSEGGFSIRSFVWKLYLKTFGI